MLELEFNPVEGDCQYPLTDMNTVQYSAGSAAILLTLIECPTGNIFRYLLAQFGQSYKSSFLDLSIRFRGRECWRENSILGNGTPLPRNEIALSISCTN